MLSDFHFTEKAPERDTSPYDIVSLEESIALPSLEDVEMLPESPIVFNTETARLEEAGMQILHEIYKGEEKAGVRCKGTLKEDFRV